MTASIEATSRPGSPPLATITERLLCIQPDALVTITINPSADQHFHHGSLTTHLIDHTGGLLAFAAKFGATPGQAIPLGLLPVTTGSLRVSLSRHGRTPQTGTTTSVAAISRLRVILAGLPKPPSGTFSCGSMSSPASRPAFAVRISARHRPSSGPAVSPVTTITSTPSTCLAGSIVEVRTPYASRPAYRYDARNQVLEFTKKLGLGEEGLASPGTPTTTA